KREAARQGRTMVRTSRDRIAPTARLSTKAGKDPCPSKVPQRRSITCRRCRPRCPVPRHGGSLVLAVDTNVLVYAADADSQFHTACRENLAGNLLHDAHTAILMRKHGIGRICTRDTDFNQFPFLEAIDPLRP